MEQTFCDPGRVAKVEWNICVINQQNYNISQPNADFHVIATNLNWNPSAIKNARRMELYTEMKNFFLYNEMYYRLSTYIPICQTQNDQIEYIQAEKATQQVGGGQSITYSPKPPTTPHDAAAVLPWNVVLYNGPVLIDLRAPRKMILVEEWAQRIAVGRYLYCCWFNHKAAEYEARKKPQIFHVAGAKILDAEMCSGSEESGKDSVN